MVFGRECDYHLKQGLGPAWC